MTSYPLLTEKIHKEEKIRKLKYLPKNFKADGAFEPKLSLEFTNEQGR